MIDLTAATFDGVVKKHPVILVDFWAAWCAPCRAMMPVISGLAEAMPDLVIGKVDIDPELELATRFRISAIPTLMFIVEGHEVARLTGATSLPKLIAWVREHQGAVETNPNT
ncbi:thioredoxin family protein [Candidatus Uhrbacteria bacterium]|nr:thioredoxin family protein [Candidatus Uhrbacteria bacterium]